MNVIAFARGILAASAVRQGVTPTPAAASGSVPDYFAGYAALAAARRISK